VRGCRQYIFHPKEHDNLPKVFDDAKSKLDGIELLFPEGKISRYIQNFRDELSQLRRLAGIDSQ
jgi:hypothetical protein